MTQCDDVTYFLNAILNKNATTRLLILKIVAYYTLQNSYLTFCASKHGILRPGIMHCISLAITDP